MLVLPDARIGGAASNLDAKANVDTGFRPALSTGLEAGSEVQPTQPPHPPLEVEMVPSSVSGYHNISGMAGTSGLHRMTMGDYVPQGTAGTGDISHILAATQPTLAIRNPSHMLVLQSLYM